MTTNLHSAWAQLFVRALSASGVRHVVISPGSRSTPLAVAAASDPGLVCHAVIDERTAGFFALGQARITGIPSVLLCTSGTAGGHYLPALIEASQCYLPMVVLTADRPWEAYDAGSSQTIDQVKLFGDHVRHYAELGLPDPSLSSLLAVQRIAAQAVWRATSPCPGPVHLNARFRKPLEPTEVSCPEAWEPAWVTRMEQGPPRIYTAPRVCSAQAVEEVAQQCRTTSSGWIVCGPRFFDSDSARFREAVLMLGRATGFPLVPEATSGVRFGSEGQGGVTVLSCSDACLRVPAWRARYAPELLLEFGLPSIGVGYAALLEERTGGARYGIAPYGWNDPFGGVTARIEADPALFAEQLAAACVAPSQQDLAHKAAWLRAEEAVKRLVREELATGLCTEAALAAHLIELLPSGTTLVIGNSSTVRDLDTYCMATSRSLQVVHQRGASGIDGLIAGAVGVSSVTEGPTVLLVGDVSVAHDLGSLQVARRTQQPLVIVVVNNGGGRLFEQLPLAQNHALQELFTTYFTTPPELLLEHAAALFGLCFQHVETLEQFSRAMHQGLVHEGVTLVEACVVPHASAARACLWQQVGCALSLLEEDTPIPLTM